MSLLTPQDALKELLRYNGPVALDTETEHCNPKKQSPVTRASVWCMTLAWGQPVRSAFIRAPYLPDFAGWLSSPEYQKVGTKILSYDRHALANEGLELTGVVGDTWLMSKLLDPSKYAGHGLKDWGQRLGFHTVPYAEVAGVVQKVQKHYKTTSTRTKGLPWPVTTAEGEVWEVRWGKTELLQLSTLWKNYPTRRQKIVDYAVQDAIMSLSVYEHLRVKLEETKWH